MIEKKYKREVSCGIIPIYINAQNEKEYLLVQLHAGHWSFPKGHMEPNETCIETAQRELFEETGLVCSSVEGEHMVSESYLVKRPDTFFHKTAHYFIGYVDDKKLILQDEEIKNSFWGNEKEVLEKITYKESKELFKRALSTLE